MSTCLATPEITAKKSQNQKDMTKRYRSIKPGNAAEAELVEEYLPLVKTVVGRLAMTLPPHVDIEDLYSSGLVGLLNAVRNYDPKGGSSFESYARVRIRGAVFDELRRLDWVPRSVHDKPRKVQTIMQRLEQQNGAVPTNAQMAKALDMTLPQYEELLTEIRPATFVCLDSAPCADEEGETTRYESIADHSQENPVDVTSRRELAS